MPFINYHRRSIRLHDFDYRQAGAYYVTLAAFRREDLFGLQVQDQVRLNDVGQVVAYTWQELTSHFAFSLDEWILMPDHMHAILFLENTADPEARGSEQVAGTLPGSLGAIIQNFKAITTRKINRMRRSPGLPAWQRNYYEHVIRGDRELENIRRYIVENPLRHFLRETADYDV